jgi:pyruvate formate lyase activating enzyme
MKEAYLYDKLDNQRVQCNLCNHHCIIKNGGKGICGVRENIDGMLISLVYEKVIARHVDPIEKKPLFHFLPASNSYSIATVGCNFRCLFCQNADISQMPADHTRILGDKITPADIVKDAHATRSSTIAYTYTEPTIYYELAVDTARLAVKEDIRNIFVSNGYMTRDCLEDMHPNLHGANIDLKAFSDAFYKKQCGGKLQPILNTLETLKEMGVWVEVTTLLIPGLNDSDEELTKLAQYLVNLDPNIPWHISRFHPTYRLTHINATAPEGIHKAKEIGYESGLRYVYTGNLPGDEGEKTFCHECGKVLIDRFGFYVRKNNIRNNRCPACETVIPGVWA